MSLLMGNAPVTTRYGGGFVQSIDGLSGGQEAGRPVDWFYYVNGVEASKGAAATNVHPGDHIWWDRHDWSQTDNVPAVVGSFPEPFLNGIGGKRLPVRVECAVVQGEACRTVAARLRSAGANLIGHTNVAAWLAGLMARLMPEEPEVLGLLALMRLHLARAEARFDGAGNIVLLQDQDRARWDRERIASAMILLQRAAALRQTGPYQLQAAIAACHAEARTWEETDWRQIVALYDALLEILPSPVVQLNRAIARRYLDGAGAAFPEVDALAEALDNYYLFHATRAELLRDLGREPEARAALARALELTANPAERALLRKRLS